MRFRWLVSFLVIGSMSTWLWHAQAQRGQGVRIKVENGQELDLYDESHALVIGVSAYNNGWKKLPGVKRDVVEVSAVLTRQGFKVEQLPDPTREEFDAALRLFISRYGLKERNRLVVYFAGHGHTERLGDDRDLGYIVMRNAPLPDSDPGNFYLASVSMDEINSAALRIKAKHALFVFDSCFSGSIFRSEPAKRRPARIEIKSAQPVRQFITSGNAGQEVPDDSLFRRYFVRAFEGEGDLDGDDYLTGEELGIFLSGRVASDTRDTQTPRYGKIRDARLNLGDLIFALPKKAAPTPPPAPPVVAPTPTYLAEQALWETVKDSQKNEELERYQEKYCPGGIYCDAAEIRLARLRPVVITPPAGNNNATTSTPPPVRTSVTGVPLRSFDYQTVSIDASGKVSPKRGGQAWGYTENINGVALEMVEIEGGTFTMGSPVSEAERENDEGPQHSVTVSGYAVGKYEVTQGQWAAVAKLPKVKIDLPAAPANFKGAELPVEQVSWEEAVEFCARLSRLTGRTYRLPSEAEWEYAARAGTTTPFAFGATITPEVVNYDGNYPYGRASRGSYRKTTVAVGSLGVANGFGLYDMHGNVCEWCEDVWHESYQGAPSDGSAWLSGGDASYRVLRGGSWLLNGRLCRAAFRIRNAPGERDDSLGFRVVSSARTRP